MEKQQSFSSILEEKLRQQQDSAPSKKSFFDPTLTDSLENRLPFHRVKTVHFKGSRTGFAEYLQWQDMQTNKAEEPSREDQKPHSGRQSQAPQRDTSEAPVFYITRRDLSKDEEQALCDLQDLGADLTGQRISEADLTRCFRQLAKALHPDSHPEASAQKAQSLAQSFHEMREKVSKLRKVIARLKPDDLAQAA